MCGIVGTFNLARDVSPEMAKSLKDLKHRGPDMEGVFSEFAVNLGHVRLSIQDTTQGASQPFFSKNERYVLVFNGEIYNHLELREKYLSNLAFRTTSDTETLIELYSLLGEKCINLLVGMFAFVIYDRKTDALLAGRDSFGIKPLYYWSDGTRLIFSSELKAFRNFKEVAWELDLLEMHHYLTYQTTSLEGTLIRNVHLLPPGHIAHLSLGQPLRKTQFNPTKFETVDRPVISGVVQDRLLSDVPLGVFLSGGVDSTILAVLSNQLLPHVKCITLGFSDSNFDESTVASHTARTHELNHSIERIDPESVKQSVLSTLAKFDCPSADGFNSYLVSKAAKQSGLTVALSGLGADEIFGGYSSFRQYSKVSRVFRWAIFKRPLIWTIRHFRLNPKLIDLLTESDLNPVSYTSIMRQSTGMEVIKQVIPNFNSTQIAETQLRLSKLVSPEDNDKTKISKTELFLYTIPLLLRDTDQASMLNSLEVRVPFMDHRLVLATHADEKTRELAEKGFLKGLFKDLLGPTLSTRPKTGFVLPWNAWFRDDFSEFIENAITNLSQQGLIHSDFTLNEFEKFKNNKSLVNWSFWMLLLSLDVWLQEYNVSVT